MVRPSSSSAWACVAERRGRKESPSGLHDIIAPHPQSSTRDLDVSGRVRIRETPNDLVEL